MLQQALATLAIVDGITVNRRRELLDQQPQEEFLGPNGTMRYFNSASGQRICCYYYPAQGRPKGVVQLVHGMGSFLCYDYLSFQGVGKPKAYTGSWIAALNAAGYSVAGADHQGFGRSSGLFGYVATYKDWVADVLSLTALLGVADLAGFAGLPVFLLGSSMGGNLALHAAIQQPQLYAGCVLLAPMVSLEKVKASGANRLLLSVARLANWLIPTWPVVATNKNTMFPQLQEDWDACPVTYHYQLRARIGVECMAACGDAVAGLGAMRVPFLVFHSKRDTMTDPEGSRMLLEAAQSPDKTLRPVDAMWHILVKEPGNRELLTDILNWLEPRTAAAAAAGEGGGGSSSGQPSNAEAAAAAAAGSSAARVRQRPGTTAALDKE